jgi:hypothetical protein
MSALINAKKSVLKQFRAAARTPDVIHMDSLFPVKFAYLLDRAFQNFVQNLGNFHNHGDPIARAKKRLRGQQVRDIDAAMSGFKTGALSQLFLFRGLFKEKLRQKLTPRETEEQRVLGIRNKKQWQKAKTRPRESRPPKNGGLRTQAR